MGALLGKILRGYVRGVDRINDVFGHIAMYSFFAILGILSYGVFTNVILKDPVIWVMEMAQFTMAAYYLLGGGYTLKEGAHVRMDVLYDRWSPRTKAAVDSLTGLVLLFYLGVLCWGGWFSVSYSLEFAQKNFTAWGPPLAPIKIIMLLGMFLMLLQAIALWLRDIAKAFGKELA